MLKGEECFLKLLMHIRAEGSCVSIVSKAQMVSCAFWQLSLLLWVIQQNALWCFLFHTVKQSATFLTGMRSWCLLFSKVLANSVTLLLPYFEEISHESQWIVAWMRLLQGCSTSFTRMQGPKCSVDVALTVRILNEIDAHQLPCSFASHGKAWRRMG